MNDLCPVCEEPIGVEQSFAGGESDYATYFDYECEHCGANLHIEVEAIPVFIIKGG